MAVSVSSTDVKAILKTLWPQSRVENMVYKDHPLLAMLAKDEGFYGENLVLAVRYADTQGRSADFATAQSNAGSFAARKFILTRAKDYQVVSLETEAILASEKDKGALIKVLDTEMTSGMNNISKSLATAVYRGQSGALAQTASDPGTGTTIALANINDVTSFTIPAFSSAGSLVAAHTEGTEPSLGTFVTTAIRDIVTSRINVPTSIAPSSFKTPEIVFDRLVRLMTTSLRNFTSDNVEVSLDNKAARSAS